MVFDAYFWPPWERRTSWGTRKMGKVIRKVCKKFLLMLSGTSSDDLADPEKKWPYRWTSTKVLDGTPMNLKRGKVNYWHSWQNREKSRKWKQRKCRNMTWFYCNYNGALRYKRSGRNSRSSRTQGTSCINPESCWSSADEKTYFEFQSRHCWPFLLLVPLITTGFWGVFVTPNSSFTSLESHGRILNSTL